MTAPRTVAVISLGTNTIRFLVARATGDAIEILEQDQIGTRLGEGLRDAGPLAPAAKARTLAAVRTFAARIRDDGVRRSCIATSAMRRASDALAFAADVSAAGGAPLEVLDGATEAAASFRGATSGRAPDGARIAVLDIGGGSTECAVGRNGVLEEACSIEIGSVRVTEGARDLDGRAPGSIARAAADAARAELRDTLAPLVSLGAIDELIAVAGTALTLGAIAQGSDVSRMAGVALRRVVVDATVERLLARSLDERRRLPGMLAQRADVLAAGGLILSEAMTALRVPACRLEANDLLLGHAMVLLGR